MVLPIVTPAPVVVSHGDAFRDLFDNQREFRHFQNYLTGLMVLENKSMANISRCILSSADKTNLSRFFSEAPWDEEATNNQRIRYMLEQTVSHRRSPDASCLILDDTLCEHVGSLFEYVVINVLLDTLTNHRAQCARRYCIQFDRICTVFCCPGIAFLARSGLQIEVNYLMFSHGFLHKIDRCAVPL